MITRLPSLISKAGGPHFPIIGPRTYVEHARLIAANVVGLSITAADHAYKNANRRAIL